MTDKPWKTHPSRQRFYHLFRLRTDKLDHFLHIAAFGRLEGGEKIDFMEEIAKIQRKPIKGRGGKR